VESAASEMRQQVERDVAMVAERRGRCVDETKRVHEERRQFIDDVEKTAATIRQTVSHTTPSTSWLTSLRFN